MSDERPPVRHCPECGRVTTAEECRGLALPHDPTDTIEGAPPEPEPEGDE